jgi:transposase
VEDIAFWVLAAGNQPNFRTISDFRKIHLKTLERLFEQVLQIALEAGAMKAGRVALERRSKPTPGSTRPRVGSVNK